MERKSRLYFVFLPCVPPLWDVPAFPAGLGWIRPLLPFPEWFSWIQSLCWHSQHGFFMDSASPGIPRVDFMDPTPVLPFQGGFSWIHPSLAFPGWFLWIHPPSGTPRVDFMDPFFPSGIPRVVFMDPSPSGIPRVDFMDPFFPSGIPGVGFMDPFFPSGIPGVDFMDPFFPSGIPRVVFMDPFFPSGIPGVDFMDPFFPSGIPGVDFMDPLSPSGIPGVDFHGSIPLWHSQLSHPHPAAGPSPPPLFQSPIPLSLPRAPLGHMNSVNPVCHRAWEGKNLGKNLWKTGRAQLGGRGRAGGRLCK
ncbi:ameloblastin isoform X3 [Corvus moneduloides]|uniref:ameloblastin isoform X3 n=1 Tax=Corvus moneduloides TaxID=1196302 RepID=UPI001362B608|nr:ameloblastin isoform X3 [Corvus moneduloides]